MDAGKRGCYCTLWQKKPEFLRDRGLPEGFCGWCDRCGKPGHIRHAPNGMPYTGSWCDRCFVIVRFTRPLILWIIAYGLIAYAIAHFTLKLIR